jgi:hypothetical protein
MSEINENKIEQSENNIPEFPEPEENISVTDAMTGVLTEPSDTFEEVRKSRRSTYWMLPLIILSVITVLAAFLVVNDEDLYSEIKELQMSAVKKNFDKSVEQGSMSREEADSQLEKTENMFSKSSPLFWVSTLAGPIFGIFISFFVRGLVLWGGVKIFGGIAGYLKILSVLGLAGMVDIIQTVLNTVLAIIMGRLMVHIGPLLFITKDMVGDSAFKFLAHFDIFNFWWIYLVGIGIAIVSGIKKWQGLLIVLTLWILWSVLSSFLSFSFLG